MSIKEEENCLKERQGQTLVYLMRVLIILILCVIVSVFWNSCASRCYRQKFNEHIGTVINMAQDNKGCCNEQNGLVIPIANDTAKGNNTYVLIKKSYLKDILQQHITDHSNIMDTNNSLAIILTLITLCISLAVIIPYIMGKSILKTDIRNAVEEMHESETVKYQELVDQLERSEAHLSRMTAYNLLVDYKLNLNKCDACGKRTELDTSVHPFWSIGWAAKAIIRYQNCTSQGFAADKFIDNCIIYIKDAGMLIKENKLKNDENGVVLRAFVDLFDVLYSPSINNSNKIKENKFELDAVLSQLWSILNKCYKDEKYIITQMEAKSIIHEDFLNKGQKGQDFRILFERWKAKLFNQSFVFDSQLVPFL